MVFKFSASSLLLVLFGAFIANDMQAPTPRLPPLRGHFYALSFFYVFFVQKNVFLMLLTKIFSSFFILFIIKKKSLNFIFYIFSQNAMKNIDQENFKRKKNQKVFLILGVGTRVVQTIFVHPTFFISKSLKKLKKLLESR